MGHLDIAGWFLLFHLLVFLPWAAVKSRRRVAALEAADDATRAAAEAALPRGARLLVGTLIMLLVLAAFCLLIAQRWRYALFEMPPLTGRMLALAAIALALQFGFFALSRRLKSTEERRRSFARLMTPRTPVDWLATTSVCLLAGFAEEAAYRGLGMVALTTLTGSWLASAAILSVAFAVGHAVQGWKNACIVALMAASMHALVLLTGTLVLAMIVHATFDLVAIEAARRFYRTAPATA
jgi:hypothetical protein